MVNNEGIAFSLAQVQAACNWIRETKTASSELFIHGLSYFTGLLLVWLPMSKTVLKRSEDCFTDQGL